jgi:hypothetical protein
MENELPEKSGNGQPGRRRRRRKSSKELFERRRRWRRMALWLAAGHLAGVLVAVIAVFAGRGVYD